MENKVYVVARSRTNDVDVGDILDQIGGGGHPSAAAATVKGKTIAQTEQLLFEIPLRQNKPQTSGSAFDVFTGHHGH